MMELPPASETCQRDERDEGGPCLLAAFGLYKRKCFELVKGFHVQTCLQTRTDSIPGQLQVKTCKAPTRLMREQ